MGFAKRIGNALDDAAEGFTEGFLSTYLPRMERQEKEDSELAKALIAKRESRNATVASQKIEDGKLRTQAKNMVQSSANAPQGSIAYIYNQLKTGRKYEDVQKEFQEDISKGNFGNVPTYQSAKDYEKLPAYVSSTSASPSITSPVTSGLDTSKGSKAQKTAAKFLGVDRTARNKEIMDKVNLVSPEVKDTAPKVQETPQSNVYNPLTKRIFETIDFDKEFSEVDSLEKANRLKQRVLSEDLIKDTNHRNSPLYTELMNTIDKYVKQKAEDENADLAGLSIENLTALIAIRKSNGVNTTSEEVILAKKLGYKVAENVDEFFKPTNISRILKDNTTPESMQAQIDLAKSLGASETRYQVLTEQKKFLEENAKQFDKWPKDLGSIDSEADRQAAQSKLFYSYGVQSIGELEENFPAAHDSWIKIIESSKKEEAEQDLNEQSSLSFSQAFIQNYIAENPNNVSDKNKLTLEAQNALKETLKKEKFDSFDDYITGFTNLEDARLVAEANGQTDIVTKLTAEIDKRQLQKDSTLSMEKLMQKNMRNSQAYIMATPEVQSQMEKDLIQEVLEARQLDPKKDIFYYGKLLNSDFSNAEFVLKQAQMSGAEPQIIALIEQQVAEFKTKEEGWYKDPREVNKTNYISAIWAAEANRDMDLANLLKVKFNPSEIPLYSRPEAWTKKNIAAVRTSAFELPPQERDDVLIKIDRWINTDASLSESERKIARLVSVGASRSDAIALLDGKMQYIPNPITGNLYVLNKLTNTVEEVNLNNTAQADASLISKLEEIETTIPERVNASKAVGFWPSVGNVANIVLDTTLNTGYVFNEQGQLAAPYMVINNMMMKTSLQSALPGKESKALMERYEAMEVRPFSPAMPKSRARDQLQALVYWLTEVENKALSEPSPTTNARLIERTNSLLSLRQMRVNYERLLEDFGVRPGNTDPRSYTDTDYSEQYNSDDDNLNATDSTSEEVNTENTLDLNETSNFREITEDMLSNNTFNLNGEIVTGDEFKAYMENDEVFNYVLDTRTNTIKKIRK